jgi:ketosteroid isomerase-like protein
MTVVEVDAVAQAFHDGVANRDAAALASLYHEDGRFLPPNIERARTGRRSRQRCSSCLTWGARSLDVEPVEVREAGDMTIEYGRYTWTSSLRAQPRSRTSGSTSASMRPDQTA